MGKTYRKNSDNSWERESRRNKKSKPKNIKRSKLMDYQDNPLYNKEQEKYLPGHDPLIIQEYNDD